MSELKLRPPREGARESPRPLHKLESRKPGKCRKKRNTENTEIGAPFEAPLEARGKQGKQRPRRSGRSAGRPNH
jgi:hypothetical protein